MTDIVDERDDAADRDADDKVRKLLKKQGPDFPRRLWKRCDELARIKSVTRVAIRSVTDWDVDEQERYLADRKWLLLSLEYSGNLDLIERAASIFPTYLSDITNGTVEFAATASERLGEELAARKIAAGPNDSPGFADEYFDAVDDELEFIRRHSLDVYNLRAELQVAKDEFARLRREQEFQNSLLIPYEGLPEDWAPTPPPAPLPVVATDRLLPWEITAADVGTGGRFDPPPTAPAFITGVAAQTTHEVVSSSFVAQRPAPIATADEEPLPELKPVVKKPALTTPSGDHSKHRTVTRMTIPESARAIDEVVASERMKQSLVVAEDNRFEMTKDEVEQALDDYLIVRARKDMDDSKSGFCKYIGYHENTLGRWTKAWNTTFTKMRTCSKQRVARQLADIRQEKHHQSIAKAR